MSQITYEYQKPKKPMYVRVRCPVCGMWTRLDNLKRLHVLNEEMASYSGGRAKIIHIRKKNRGLRAFWIGTLKRVLARLGFEIEVEIPYEFKLGREVDYEYAEKGYPYIKI